MRSGSFPGERPSGATRYRWRTLRLSRQIRGEVYSGYSEQEVWRFTLIVSKGIESQVQIDWETLLPDERLTAWLTCQSSFQNTPRSSWIISTLRPSGSLR
jgi:hypothetical protein